MQDIAVSCGHPTIPPPAKDKPHLPPSTVWLKKNRSAIDAMVFTVSKARREFRSGSHVTLLGKDITSAFNHVRHQPVLDILEEHNLPDIRQFCTVFLRSHTIQIHYNGEAKGLAIHLFSG
jgi:predicted nucleotidyltransferase